MSKLTAEERAKIKEAMSDAARVLGKIKTKRKAAASRENGKLGGRPKKSERPRK